MTGYERETLERQGRAEISGSGVFEARTRGEEHVWDWWRALSLVIVALTLCSCSVGRDTGAAGHAVNQTATPTPVVTVTVTTTVTSTATVTRTTTATVTAAPATVTAAPVGSKDVTAEYVAWRRNHYDREYPEDAEHRLVVYAELDGGVLNVLTSMRPPMGGWNCTGEPGRIVGIPVKYVRVLYQDSSVFRVCQVR
jgi:hypothetical protein